MARGVRVVSANNVTADEEASELVGAGRHEGTAGLGYRVTVRFKLIALIYESIISSLSKSGIDSDNLRAPRPADRWLSFLGWSPFFI